MRWSLARDLEVTAAGGSHLLDAHDPPSLAVLDTESDPPRVVGAATEVNGGNGLGCHEDY